MSSSACTHVLETIELLEAVLAQLPQRDLLLAQSISRRFQSTIKTSPRLQRALYLRAAPVKDPKSWTINPLLRDAFLVWFVVPRAGTQNIYTLELLDWTKDEKRRTAFIYKDASWRRMLVIQPPPKKLSIIRFWNMQYGYSARTAEIPFESHPSGGVPMSSLYDLVHSFIYDDNLSDYNLSDDGISDDGISDDGISDDGISDDGISDDGTVDDHVNNNNNVNNNNVTNNDDDENYRDFELLILDSDTGPQITLNLLRIGDYIPDYCDEGRYLFKSEDAPSNAVSELDLRLVGQGLDEVVARRYQFDESSTDLLIKRGGVGREEFNKWLSERDPFLRAHWASVAVGN
ncbi:hypothetical protein K504DRAFT_419492 [Pleomassaria siparia CBS 279.74]|uniref:F-box domain-containing protein n=1 Tax=Pleomassaria siparia CBS 279.74 TaxID=1314801 RepID=A0A6G1JRT5_9PLEO|nr:hypothetical protein K504DRAFT_419492 [Pleomassaria siparia CBS 279.74]